MRTSSLWSLIKSEPYRIFFLLGWIAGIIGTTYWIFVSTKITLSYNPLFHGLVQIELFASAFAIGFLLTALPKFLRTTTATNTELISLLAAYFALTTALLFNTGLIAQYCFISILLLLIRFAALRFRQRQAAPPDSFFLVGFGLFHGILGAAMILLPSAQFPLIGQKLLEQGMFLCLSLGIGCFLGPRLMGLVNSTNTTVNILKTGQPDLSFFKGPRFTVFLFGAIIFLSFFLETGLNRNAGLFLRAITSTACLFQFGVLKLPPRSSVVGIFVAFALWSMVLGLWLAAMLPGHEVGALHITYIGGFGLLILSIGAQVISSHGGYPRFWAEHKAWAILTATLVAFSVLLRALATALPNYYFLLLGTAALCFDLALALWGLGLLRHLLRRS